MLFAVPATATGVTSERADVVGQGPDGDVVAADGATVQRSDKGISVRLRMRTPAPESYMYPPGNEFQPLGAFPGHPEAFSLWVFVFNHPHLCDGPCGSDDLGADKPAMGGAFSGGGHLVGGRTLNVAGHVSLNTTPFVGSKLLEPRTAELHLAVAPHGALQPHVLPDQISKPIGDPSFWWLAIFD